MNEEQKKQIHEPNTNKPRQKAKFWPDIIYKDLLISLGYVPAAGRLAIFIGVPTSRKPIPATPLHPRPEWYFLFLFEILECTNSRLGKIEWIGTAIIPGLAGAGDVFPAVHRSQPLPPLEQAQDCYGVMTVIVLGMVGLTIRAVATTPPQEETGTLPTPSLSRSCRAGPVSVHCVECHGADGEGGEIKGVEGLEGVVLDPINTQDVMYTFTDETLYNIIAYGQPDLGMPPFGKAFGGELGPADMDNMVTFMRYTWDDRAELPAGSCPAAAIPALAPDEVPSYEVHIAPIIKRYCISCHRPG